MIDELIKLVREGFKSMSDRRKYNSTYSLEDLLSAGFAIFSLKDPSRCWLSGRNILGEAKI